MVQERWEIRPRSIENGNRGETWVGMGLHEVLAENFLVGVLGFGEPDAVGGRGSVDAVDDLDHPARVRSGRAPYRRADFLEEGEPRSVGGRGRGALCAAGERGERGRGLRGAGLREGERVGQGRGGDGEERGWGVRDGVARDRCELAALFRLAGRVSSSRGTRVRAFVRA